MAGREVASNAPKLNLQETEMIDNQPWQSCVFTAALGSHFAPGQHKDCLLVVKAPRNDHRISKSPLLPETVEWVVLRNGGVLQDFHEVTCTLLQRVIVITRA